MTERGGSRTLRATGAILILVGVIAAAGVTSSAAVASTVSGGADISVDVIDDQPTPNSTPSPSGSASGGTQPGGSGAGGTGGAGSGVGSGSGGTGSSGGAGGAGSMGTGGSTPAGGSVEPPGERVLLYVSGLDVKGYPSVNPLVGGRVTVSVSVHNLTAETFDSEAEFHIDDLFGNEIAKVSSVAMTALAPDELRTVEVDFGEIRIAGLVQAYATVTPPEVVAGAPMAPIKRDAWSVLPSWYAVGILLVASISLGIGAYVRRRGAL